MDLKINKLSLAVCFLILMIPFQPTAKLHSAVIAQNSSSDYQTYYGNRTTKSSQSVRVTKKIHPSVRRVNEMFNATNEVMEIDRPWIFDNGILFTYNGQVKGLKNLNQAAKIYLSGSFANWKEKFELKRNYFGVYQVFIAIPLKPGKYTYRFWVDGLWVNDQEQPYQTFDRGGEKLSYFVLNEELLFTVEKSPEFMGVFHRFYLRDQGYREVYWVSSKTGWNPNIHNMQLKNGYWIYDEIINKNELYFFWVDGKKVFDPLNSQVFKTKFGFEANFVSPAN